MQKEDKERVVADLTERLRQAETLFVADYRGLTMPQIDALRGRLLENGARLSVVKNTLTRRAAEAAGSEALLALLEGPSAIAFIEADGDMVAVAKALADAARDTRVLEIRGGVMQGREIPASAVEDLAKLPPLDILRGQVLAAVIAPLSAFAALVRAPLQNLHGLIDARIEQLQEQGGDAQGGDPQGGDPQGSDAQGGDAQGGGEAEASTPVRDESSQTPEAPAEDAPEQPAAEAVTQEPTETETQEA